MRSKNTMLNILSVWLGQLLIIFVNLIARKIFLQSLGSEYLGLNSLFANIVGLLTVADLGFGNAINFSLYKPLADNDVEAVKSLMRLYKKIYCTIGSIIMLAGALIVPWIRTIATGTEQIENIRLIFMIFVSNTAISYFFSYYTALVIADQKKYIYNICHYALQLFMYGLQIWVLIRNSNYYIYLACQMVVTVLENVIMAVVAKRKYPYLCEKNINRVSDGSMRDIKKNIKALILNKIGSPLITSTDNILISRLTNLYTVGVYGNYSTIVTAVCNVFWQGVSAFTASIGNQLVGGTKKEHRDIFSSIQLIGSWMYGWGCICLWGLLTPFVKIWYGNYTLEVSVVLMICFNSYLSGQRTVLQAYIDAAGTYHSIRYRAIVEGIVNIITSIVLGRVFGLIGIFAGTFVSGFFCGWLLEAKVVCREVLNMKTWTYIKMQLKNFGSVLFAGYITTAILNMVSVQGITGFICRLLVCVILPNIILFIFNYKSNAYKICVIKLKNVMHRKSGIY